VEASKGLQADGSHLKQEVEGGEWKVEGGEWSVEDGAVQSVTNRRLRSLTKKKNGG
jgi:hypothetical protein